MAAPLTSRYSILNPCPRGQRTAITGSIYEAIRNHIPRTPHSLYLALPSRRNDHITLDTTPLIGNANAPFALDFQLTSGDTTTGVVNTATLSQFQFGIGGGAATGNPFSNSGNASGTLGSTVKLNTSGSVFFNEFSEYFKPGSKVTFQLDLTNHPQPASTPDEFTFQLIDKTSNEVSTTDPSGSNSLLVIDLTGIALQPQVYTTNGDGIAISAQITPAASASPEPGTKLLLIGAAALLAALRRWRRICGHGPPTLELNAAGLPPYRQPRSKGLIF